MRIEIDAFSTAIAGKRILDAELQNGKPEPSQFPGYPCWMTTGGFCVIFQYTLPNGRKYAVRCWYNELDNIKARTEAIARVLQSSKLPYFVDFHYIDRGIAIGVNGRIMEKPIVKMEWVKGRELKDYINDNRNDGSKLHSLAENFLTMVSDLHRKQISHGDLQHKNIMVTDDGSLVLVDYDSIYHPSMGDLSDYISGAPSYQHPARKQNKKATVYADYFSEIVIYSSLVYYAACPDAYTKQVHDSEELLFSASDYKPENITSSEGYKKLCEHSEETRFLAEKIAEICTQCDTLESIPKIEDLIAERKRKSENKSKIEIIERTPIPSMPFRGRLYPRLNPKYPINWPGTLFEPEDPIEQCKLGDSYYYGVGESYYFDGPYTFAKSKDYTEAAKWYRKAAEQGNVDAQYKLGEIYYNGGYGVAKDYSEAVKWYQKAAEQGNAGAQFKFGDMYENGYSVSKDYTEALKWYRKAAEQGYANAQCNLGYMYESGYGVAKDYTEAVKWYRKAAEQGNKWAQLSMGDIFYNGYGVWKDYTEAAKWYRKAADQGNVYAQCNLGDMYKNGYGVPKNDVEAVKWYRKAAEQDFYGYGVWKDYTEAAKWYRKAAEQGNVYAQFCLGYMYENGYGVTKDYTATVKWYRKAAEQGNANAQCNLGDMYYHGGSVSRDYTEAAKWYRKAADQGNADAQYNLGCMYYNGDGVSQNYAESVKWYRKAAEKENEKAQLQLGNMYYCGFGILKNDAEAVKWYRKAAEQRDESAQCSLGFMYYNGYGVAKDYTEAAKWYRKAADQGHAHAQCKLGDMYKNGYGVSKDYTEAVKWYQEAAEKENAEAQNKLGYMYKNGYGVAKDHAEARKWRRKAAKQGYVTKKWRFKDIVKLIIAGAICIYLIAILGVGIVGLIMRLFAKP
jgi:TPR repeat protein/serine/threonine protein kinase